MPLDCKWGKVGAMGFFDKGFDPIKEAQKAAAAAEKGIASAAEQASNAAQGAANQTGQAIGDIASKAKGAVQSIGDAIGDGPEPKSFKYNTEFVDERNVVTSTQSQNPTPEHMTKMLGDVAEGAANAASAAAAGAQGAVVAVAGKAGEIADGVKQGVENARAKEPDEYELAVIDYNQTYTDLESGGIELYQSRLRSIDLLDLITDLVNSIANTPKSFVEDIEEVSHKKRSFKESEAFAHEELDSARKSATGAGAGVAAGMAVASIAPSAAMWVATTFGTASTGAAISTLSGAAATNAAMAWLGGGALAAGGGGMAAGSAFLAMAGPIGWGVAGATLLTSIALFVKKQHKIAREKHEELLSVKRNTEALRETSAAIEALRTKTDALREELSMSFMSSCRLHGADYLSISDDEKLALGSLVNNTKSLGSLIVERVATRDDE